MQTYTPEEQGIHNRDFVNLQIHAHITRLFKNNLVLFDAIKEKYKVSKEDGEDIRKKVLDAGNDTIRDMQNLIDVFDFYLNVSRLEQAKSSRKIVKKVVTSGSYMLK